MHFGQQILKFRKDKGLSQEKLAEKLGVSRQSVTKWEADISVSELPKIVTLADLFEVSVDKHWVGRITFMIQCVRELQSYLLNAPETMM